MLGQATNELLEILVKWSRWFSRWTSQFTRDQFDDILDVETGGMLEVWADLYGVTGEKGHYELIHAMIAGDCLTR